MSYPKVCRFVKATVVLIAAMCGAMPGRAQTLSFASDYQNPLFRDDSKSSIQRVRLLSSFATLHIPVSLDGRNLNRELLREVEGRPDSRKPFDWRITDSVAGLDRQTLTATATKDGDGIVVVFTDSDGLAVARVRESGPMPFRKVRETLYTLWLQTRMAERVVSSFTMVHVKPDGTQYGLTGRVIRSLRERGPWQVVDSMPAVEGSRRGDVLQCEISGETAQGAGNALLKCGAEPNEHVVFVRGYSCKVCVLRMVLSSAQANMNGAADDAVQNLLQHRALVEQIYAPQFQATEQR